MSFPPGYEDPSKLALLRCLVGCQALKVNSGGAAKRKSIRLSPDLRYIVWEPSKRGLASSKFGAWAGAQPCWPLISPPLPALLSARPPPPAAH